MNLEESKSQFSNRRINTNGGSFHSYRIPVQSSFDVGNSSKDLPQVSQISSFQKSKTFVESHSSSGSGGQRNFLSDLRSQHRLDKEMSQSIPVSYDSPHSSTHGSTRGSHSKGGRTESITIGGGSMAKGEEVSRMSVAPVQSVQRSLTATEDLDQDSQRDDKTVTIKRKITRRKKGSEKLNTLRDSYIESLSSPKMEYDTASDTDETEIKSSQPPSYAKEVSEVVPMKSFSTNERPPTIFVTAPVTEEVLVPQKKPVVATGALLDFLNNPDRNTPPSTEVSRQTYTRESEVAPVSTYSARRENMKSKQLSEDRSLSSQTFQTKKNVNNRSEVTEEIETITLQPIGKGVQDLASPMSTTMSRPPSRAETIRSNYYREDNQQIGGYNTVPVMPKFAKANSFRNVTQTSNYDISDSFKNSGVGYGPAIEQSHTSTFFRSPNEQNQRPLFNRVSDQPLQQASFNRLANEQVVNTSFTRAGITQMANASFSRAANDSGSTYQQGANTPFGGSANQQGTNTFYSGSANQQGASTSFGGSTNQQGASTSFGGSTNQERASTSFGGSANQHGASTFYSESTNQQGLGASYGRMSNTKGANTSFSRASNDQGANRSVSRGSNDQAFGMATNKGINDQTISASQTEWHTKTESFGVGNRAYQSPVSNRVGSGSNDGGKMIADHQQYTLQMIKNSEKVWYQPHYTRDDVIYSLKDAEPGSFCIRSSTTFQNAFGLAVKVETLPKDSFITGDSESDLVRHFLIETVDQQGVRLSGFEIESIYPSLAHFVYAHTQNAGALPHRLIMPQGGASAMDYSDGTTLKSNDQYVTQQSQEQMSLGKSHMLAQSYRSLSSPGVNFTSINNSNPLHQSYKTTVMYLGKVEIDRLKGPEAVEHAIDKLFNKPNHKTTTVDILLDSTRGIALNDKMQKMFYSRQIPAQHVLYAGFDPKLREYDSPMLRKNGINRGRIMGIVVKRQKMILRENAVHLFCELDNSTNINDIVTFVNGNYLRL